MEYFELIEKRYSVRSYRSTPVEDFKLDKILNAARIAPTGENRQSFYLIVIHPAGRETELSIIYNKPWFTQAPIIICACAFLRPNQSVNVETSYLDVAIVMDHLILAATDLGLGSCWIGAFDHDAARDVLGIPEHLAPIVFATIGYSADQPRQKTRKSVEEIVKYEHWYYQKLIEN